jgi:hypothetical protein
MKCIKQVGTNWGIALAIVASFVLLPTLGIAQVNEQLCRLEISPEIAKAVLHWEGFNDFGSSKSASTESGYRIDGQGPSCRIHSVRSGGKPIDRVCTWTSRLDCGLQFNQDATSHNFSSGDVSQYGKLKWTSNDKIDVKVKRGDVLATELREVAVVKFDGRWSRGGSSGRSTSTAYFDRAWGVLLKIDGAHDFNKFGEAVIMVEFPQ